jgi:hypothetical protein
MIRLAGQNHYYKILHWPHHAKISESQALPLIIASNELLGKVEKWTAVKFKTGLLGTPLAGR